MHVEVSLGKILNPELLLKAAPPACECNVRVSVYRLGCRDCRGLEMRNTVNWCFRSVFHFNILEISFLPRSSLMALPCPVLCVTFIQSVYFDSDCARPVEQN